MAEEKIQMRMARSSPEDINQLREFFFKLEELLEDWEKDECDIGQWITENYSEQCGRHWQRLLMGYETMFENACNPNLDYLSWKPEIQEAINAFTASNKSLEPTEEHGGSN